MTASVAYRLPQPVVELAEILAEYPAATGGVVVLTLPGGRTVSCVASWCEQPVALLGAVELVKQRVADRAIVR